MALGIALGAPGIYTVPDEMRRTVGSVRMDVCGFVGVAPRGPARLPVEPDTCTAPQAFVESWRPRRRSVAVPVDSWDQYLKTFGGFEGPGRLPYAVASFFEQGGRRAYIVRVVHDYSNGGGGNSANDLAGVAESILGNVSSGVLEIRLRAKHEGAWANRLRAALGFAVTPLDLLDQASTVQLRLTPEQAVTPGTLLRLSNSDPDHPENHYQEFRFVSRVWQAGADDSADTDWFASFTAGALPAAPDSGEIVTADCLLVDSGSGLEERFSNLGLSPEHPRWLATVLYRESGWVDPADSWLLAELLPQGLGFDGTDARDVLAQSPALFAGGEDRYADIEHEDFFDRGWVLGDEQPGDGIHALSRVRELSALVVPDLYVPEALPETDGGDGTPLLSGAEFAPCVRVAAEPLATETRTPSLPKLVLNPELPTDFKTIVGLQQRVSALTDALREFVALLDVPPGLPQKQILKWRAQFNTAYAAAYYPWLNIVNLDDGRDSLVLLNPTAVAAGIIARQEHQFGVPHGPANAIARGVVSVDEWVSRQRHDQLHPLGINIFQQHRDGVWLTSGRTLSRNAAWRQLSVLRLLVMLRRALLRQMQWVVFEPNNPSLWADVRFKLESFLRQLYIAGAFKGAHEKDAFFVRCDGQLNTQRMIDAGKLLAEVGVAPAEPTEFVVVRISRDADGTLTVES